MFKIKVYELLNLFEHFGFDVETSKKFKIHIESIIQKVDTNIKQEFAINGKRYSCELEKINNLGYYKLDIKYKESGDKVLETILETEENRAPEKSNEYKPPKNISLSDGHAEDEDGNELNFKF